MNISPKFPYFTNICWHQTVKYWCDTLSTINGKMKAKQRFSSTIPKSDEMCYTYSSFESGILSHNKFPIRIVAKAIITLKLCFVIGLFLWSLHSNYHLVMGRFILLVLDCSNCFDILRLLCMGQPFFRL